LTPLVKREFLIKFIRAPNSLENFLHMVYVFPGSMKHLYLRTRRPSMDMGRGEGRDRGNLTRSKKETL